MLYTILGAHWTPPAEAGCDPWTPTLDVYEATGALAAAEAARKVRGRLPTWRFIVALAGQTTCTLAPWLKGQTAPRAVPGRPRDLRYTVFGFWVQEETAQIRAMAPSALVALERVKEEMRLRHGESVRGLVLVAAVPGAPIAALTVESLARGWSLAIAT